MQKYKETIRLHGGTAAVDACHPTKGIVPQILRSEACPMQKHEISKHQYLLAPEWARRSTVGCARLVPDFVGVLVVAHGSGAQRPLVCSMPLRAQVNLKTWREENGLHLPVITIPYSLLAILLVSKG